MSKFGFDILNICCNIHDTCYATCDTSRKACDTDFSYCLNQKCYEDNRQNRNVSTRYLRNGGMTKKCQNLF